jgi:hypothetical protein
MRPTPTVPILALAAALWAGVAAAASMASLVPHEICGPGPATRPCLCARPGTRAGAICLRGDDCDPHSGICRPHKGLR